MRGKKRMLILCVCLLVCMVCIVIIWLYTLKAPLGVPQQDYTRLSFWTVSESYADYMLSCAQRFNEQCDGEKINLDVQVYSRSFIVDQINKSLLNDDQIPDLADIRFVDMHQFVNSAEHTMFFYPLNSLIETDDAPETATLEPFSFNSTLLALPYGSGEMALFMNVELLDKYGVDPDGISSWEDFWNLGKELKEDGINLLAVDVNNWDLMLAAMLQRDPELANAADDQAIAHSDVFRETYATLRSAVREGVAIIPEELDIYNQSFYASFQAGECACVVAPMEYAYNLIHNMPDLSGKIRIRPLPGGEEGDKSPLVAQYGTVILAKGKNIRLAKHFLQFAKLGEERYREMTDALYVGSVSEQDVGARRTPRDSAFAAYFGEDALLSFDAAEKCGFSSASGLPAATLQLTEDLLDASEECN